MTVNKKYHETGGWRCNVVETVSWEMAFKACPIQQLSKAGWRRGHQGVDQGQCVMLLAK